MARILCAVVCMYATCYCNMLGLARTVYIRCIHGIFGREIIYGVHIRFWPTLNMQGKRMIPRTRCICSRVSHALNTKSLELAKTMCMHTMYDHVLGGFPAKNNVYTLYIYDSQTGQP